MSNLEEALMALFRPGAIQEDILRALFQGPPNPPAGPPRVVDLTHEIPSPPARSRPAARDSPPAKKRKKSNGKAPAATSAPLTRSDGKAVRYDPTHMASADCTQVCMDNAVAMEQYTKNAFCPICLDEFNELASTSCGHLFCAPCISNAVAVNGKCPLCQASPVQIHLLHM
ncbi:hypothetical protein SPRG_07002 [Saprolegnia parasitica CBS 223.65]|uniref:RING-type domain-containing protein n=1 Tax=Saprolegnia parasitica (strain CBS 223.65) TaxID=695850 RepID=A0A067CE02_SAPPC|nr:hypothetical protein SPRG_07002 [Saprolegnia parasitica CBS 223.65]KDO27415.1 hypothetical protein SPRG_07002 [Saprolegnia parasitica CBS 223.65]|eukprot:XP_012201855.1 hypothetical protein SPRG_07002 [Saprolegnia parasitica CBS 223.65]